MSLMQEMSKSALVRRLHGADEGKVKNAFLANYIAALVMLKLQDLKGLMLVNDRAHAKLTSFADGMSDINFWGRALFYPKDPLVKGAMQFGHADILAHESGRILDSRVQKIMLVPLTAPEQVNWDEAVANLLLLKHRYSVASSYYNRVAFALHKWDSLNEGSKRKAVGDAFMYLMQADPRSNLLSRMRELSGTSMMRDLSTLAMRIVKFARIQEDEGGAGTVAGNVGSCSLPVFGSGTNAIIKQATTNNPALDNAYVYKAGEDPEHWKAKRIKKRVRKFKLIKFRAPTKKEADNV